MEFSTSLYTIYIKHMEVLGKKTEVLKLKEVKPELSKLGDPKADLEELAKISNNISDTIFNNVFFKDIELSFLGAPELILFYMLFFIGLSGIIFNYKNYLVTMFCIEIMYLGITICFIIVSILTIDPKGQIYGLLLIIIAAAESAIGLGILIVLSRFGKSIEFESYQELKG